MRKFTIIILLALTLTGCETIKTEDTEEYQYGYEVGDKEGYKAGYEDGQIEGYKNGYHDAQIEFDPDYIRNNYHIDEIYDFDSIEEYLEDNDYVIITLDEYMKYIETADY